MEKHRLGLHLNRNAYVDAGDGVISFPNGQVITDGTQQRNGTRYDIASMDLSEYKGQVTAQHEDGLLTYVGEALGVAKTANADAVTISGIRFATKETAMGRVAYDLMRGGFPLDLSIETYGPWPEESDDTYYSARLVGLSVVIVGNNKSATMGKAQMALVRNSLAQAKEEGIDTAEAEKLLGEDPEPAPVAEPAKAEPPKEAEQSINQEQPKMFVTKKNSRTFAVKVSYKNAAGDTVETELAPGATVDVSEDQAEAVEKQITEAAEPQPDIKEAITEAVNAAVKPLQEELEKVRNEAFNKGAKEPEFTKTDNGAATPNGVRNEHKELAAMGWEERTVQQIESARLFLVNKSLDGLQQLDRINKFHVQQLQDKGIVKNSVDLSAFGNFVTSPELLTEIEGTRSDYSPLVDAVNYKETLSLEMAWLERSGDIEMEEVGMEDAGSDENLKPISEYTATPRSAKLKEVAAVTPVANAATKFLAVDILADVAEGYRTSYQRKLAQIVVARLQQAINFTGNTVPLNLTSSVQGLLSMVRAIKKIVSVTPNGTFLMNVSTELELFELQVQANLTGDTLGLFQKGPNGMTFCGRPYMTVPDDLMPTLNTNETRSFVVDGQTVNVNQAILYGDLRTVSGRVSGGLNYTLSTEAAYEDNGTVKSSFQRDELLLRGFFFRNAAVRDRSKVSGVSAAGIS